MSLFNHKKENLLKISEISINLDTYDDIFSDFDPRPYSVRALSDDFLLEMQKACKEKPSGKIEVKFILPKHLSNSEHEYLIKKRLKYYFKKHYSLAMQEINKTRRKAFKFIFLGTVCSMSAAYLSLTSLFNDQNPWTNFIMHLIFVLLEPAGWFSIWTGLDKLVTSRDLKKETRSFYEKMIGAEYHFSKY